MLLCMEPVKDPNEELLARLMADMEPHEAVFVMEFSRTGKAGPSYRKARPDVKANSADAAGWAMLRNQKVNDAVRVARRLIALDLRVAAVDVLREWYLIATADPAELMRTVHRCCRYCHGENHGYQWRDEMEFAKACQTVLDDVEGTNRQPVMPDASGGFGFNDRQLVNADCPMCLGEGHRDTFIQATDKLSEGGRRLFAGVKVTKDGVEVKTRDQDAAWLHLARYIGMISNDVKLKGTLAVASGQVELTDEQKSAVTEAFKALSAGI